MNLTHLLSALMLFILFSCNEQGNNVNSSVDNTSKTLLPDTLIIKPLPKDHEIQSIIFGVYYGECGNHCVTMFEYNICGFANANTLLMDTVNNHFNEDKMIFTKQITDLNKFKIADDIIRHIPDSLITTDKSRMVFGCPDCSDGGGMYLQIRHNSRTKPLTKTFHIDCQTSQLNGEMKEFSAYLFEAINKMRGR